MLIFTNHPILMNTFICPVTNEHFPALAVRKGRVDKGVRPVQFPAMSTIVNFTGNDVEVRLSTGLPDFSNQLFGYVTK